MKKFKRVLAAITTVAVSAVSLCSVFSASANSGRETFRIYIDVPANSGVYCANISLRYTPSITDVCRLYKGTLNTDIGFTITNPYHGIDVSVYSNIDTELISAGTMGVITMTAPSSTNDLFDLVDVNIEDIYNYAGTDLPTSRIRISNIMVGDVNQDGIVNSSDATLLSNYLNGKTVLSGNALRAADTNGDFGISDDDLTHLNSYLNGTVSYFNK